MASGASRLLAPYRRLPEEMRRTLRPLNLIDELGSFLPAAIAPRLRSATEAARRITLLRRARYRVRCLEGRAAGGGSPLTCLLAMDDLSARFWRGLLFLEPPREHDVATVGALRVPRLAERLAGAVDLSLWQASWPASLLARGRTLVPSWVPLWLPIDRPLDGIIVGERSGRAARKNDVRRIERLGLRPRLADGAEAYERFRRELYEPYVRGRFGELGVVLPPHAFRHARRRGYLLLLEDDGGPRAGAVLVREREALRVLAFGAAAAPEARVALEACYYHAIRLAVEHGFRRLALGTARPVLTDGVLRYKRKWGARLGRPDTFDRFILVHRDTPGVRDVLTAAPLVVECDGGELRALVAAQGLRADQQLARVDAPGLRELALLTDSDDDDVRSGLTAPYSAVRVVSGDGTAAARVRPVDPRPDVPSAPPLRV